MQWFSLSVLALSMVCCTHPSRPPSLIAPTAQLQPQQTAYDTATRSIHVLVALCDNRYQGIVPVPPGIGNGQHPATNLYWGCAYGVKTFFANSHKWALLHCRKIDSLLMERAVFRHKQSGWYLVADAYNGQHIRQCTVDFFNGCAGKIKDTMQVNGQNIGLLGNARLLAYVGHDGLMDFSLADDFTNADGQVRDAMMLACISQRYFGPHLTPTKARPVLWSTGLMAPEAYILHDAVECYLANGQPRQICAAAAAAYHRYQRCGRLAAERLLVSGY